MANFRDVLTYAGSMTRDKVASIGGRIVQRAENKITGYIDNKIQEGIDYLTSKIPKNLLSLFYSHEDFNRLRLINHQLVHTDFIKEWNFSVEIDGAPPDLDFYVKDVTYSFFDGNSDDEQIGSMVLSWPTTQNPAKVTLNMRDNEDMRCSLFMRDWLYKVFPIRSDGTYAYGTVGLPFGDDGYLRMVLVQNLDIEGGKKVAFGGLSYPIQVGEISRSHENGEFMEFPVTLVNFATYA